MHLRYRDVEEASQRIANQHGNHEFLIGLSRLADIENKGTTPSIFRLYSLCAIYRIDYPTALAWYGVPLDTLPADASHFGSQKTQPFDMEPRDDTVITFPTEMDSAVDLRSTFHLNRCVRSWGKLPIALINGLEIRKHRYAFIGTDDWFMFPIIPPGSFLQLDEKKNRVVRNGWDSEFERPIYFVEHRSGFKCGWCSEQNGCLIMQPHSASNEVPLVFSNAKDVEVIGQVIGVVKRLDLAKKHHTRF